MQNTYSNTDYKYICYSLYFMALSSGVKMEISKCPKLQEQFQALQDREKQKQWSKLSSGKLSVG